MTNLQLLSKLGCRSGIELILNSRVNAVERNQLTVLCPDKSEKVIHFGACVWATGVRPMPDLCMPA